MNSQADTMPFVSPVSSRQIARWLGVVYVVGAATAVLWVAIPHQAPIGDAVVLIVASVALAGGMTMIAGHADNLRPLLFHLVIAAVPLVITVGYLAIPDPANDARLFYIWATPIAAFFCRPLAVALHTALVALALALALWVHNTTFSDAARIWLMTTGALVTVTSLVAWAAVGVRRRDAAMSFAATHDLLTGLPNRWLLAVRLREALERRRQNGGQVFVILADLDRFKLLNDTYGHHAGDELLNLLAPRFVEFAPPQSVVARLGGDEFAILIEDPSGEADPLDVGHRMARAWAEPIQLARGPIHTSACIGVTVATDDDDPSSLIRNADAAMYRAKSEGRSGVALYDEDQRADIQRRMDLSQALFNAVTSSQLSIVYQPVLSLVTGAVIAAEALLRWDHPQMGLISPGEFIPLAEESGMIDEIGLWVMDQAMGQLAVWRAGGLVDNGFAVDVNVSGAQLHGAFAQRVSEVLDKHRLEPSALMLELTESVLMKAGTEATEVLKGLDALGVPLALDDFGTGFSSLSYLHRAKVHTVKIDQSFVSGMSSDGTRRAIVEAVVALTRALGLRVIAEGVDTPEQIDLLVGMGCEFAQGFLVALPMPPVAMGEYLTVAHSHCVGGR